MYGGGEKVFPFGEKYGMIAPKGCEGMRLLFIGNSYTACGDLPARVAQELARLGVPAQTAAITAGGYSLAHFASERNPFGRQAAAALARQPWDFVVLQEQSLRPAAHPQTFWRSAARLAQAAAAAGARVALYETWARADGHPALARHGWTHEDMQTRLTDAYAQAAALTGGVVIPAGQAMHTAYRAGKPVLAQDGSHPSLEGTALIARVFAQTLAALDKPSGGGYTI